jgi:hypothetical protein
VYVVVMSSGAKALSEASPLRYESYAHEADTHYATDVTQIDKDVASGRSDALAMQHSDMM